MRALNEPGPPVIRLVRGEIDGTPDADVPGAWHVDRIDEAALADGRIWPQSAASQLVGLVVGAKDGERTLDLCAAPGGKATMLAGDVTAVEVNEARARELEETRTASGRRTSASSSPTGVRSPPSSRASTTRSSTRRAPGSESSIVAPTFAGEPSRSPSSSSICSGLRQSAFDRAARSSTRSARSTQTSRRPSSTRRPRGGSEPRRRVAAVQAREPSRVPADAAARPRHGRFLRRAPHRAVRMRRASSSARPTIHRARPRPMRDCGRCPSRGRARGRDRRSRGVEPARDGTGVPEEPARLELPLADERLRVDDEPRLSLARSTFPPWRSWFTSRSPIGRRCGRRQARRRAATARTAHPPPCTGAARLRPSGRPRQRGARRDARLPTSTWSRGTAPR